MLAVGDRVRNVEALCASLQLRHEGEANWFGRWWYGGDGAVLVIPDDMFSHPEGALAPLSAWRRLLSVLLRSRAGRPLDADLDRVRRQAVEREPGGQRRPGRRQEVYDLQQRLGLSLPIYLVVTETEQTRASWNWRRRCRASARRDAGLVLALCRRHRLSIRLDRTGAGKTAADPSETIAEIGALQDQASADLYLLPRSFEGVRANLQTLCDPVFRGNALGEAPQLRGIYFTGAQAAPQGELDEVAPPPALPLFAGRLLRQRVLAEQGLASRCRASCCCASAGTAGPWPPWPCSPPCGWPASAGTGTPSPRMPTRWAASCASCNWSAAGRGRN